MKYPEPDAANQKVIDKISLTLGTEEDTEGILQIVHKCKRDYYWAILRCLIRDHLEAKEFLRRHAAEIVVALLDKQEATKEELIYVLKDVLVDAEDMLIDIPLFWQYFAAYTGKLNCRSLFFVTY
jgi:hypothetical protein